MHNSVTWASNIAKCMLSMLSVDMYSFKSDTGQISHQMFKVTLARTSMTNRGWVQITVYWMKVWHKNQVVECFLVSKQPEPCSNPFLDFSVPSKYTKSWFLVKILHFFDRKFDFFMLDWLQHQNYQWNILFCKVYRNIVRFRHRSKVLLVSLKWHLNLKDMEYECCFDAIFTYPPRLTRDLEVSKSPKISKIVLSVSCKISFVAFKVKKVGKY